MGAIQYTVHPSPEARLGRFNSPRWQLAGNWCHALEHCPEATADGHRVGVPFTEAKAEGQRQGRGTQRPGDAWTGHLGGSSQARDALLRHEERGCALLLPLLLLPTLLGHVAADVDPREGVPAGVLGRGPGYTGGRPGVGAAQGAQHGCKRIGC